MVGSDSSLSSKPDNALFYLFNSYTENLFGTFFFPEQSAFFNIFPESEKNLMANSFSLLNSRADILFLLINKRITLKLWDLSIEG